MVTGRWSDELMLRHLQGNDFKVPDSAKSLATAQEWDDKNLERVMSSQTVQNLLVMMGCAELRTRVLCIIGGGMWASGRCW